MFNLKKSLIFLFFGLFATSICYAPPSLEETLENFKQKLSSIDLPCLTTDHYFCKTIFLTTTAEKTYGFNYGHLSVKDQTIFRKQCSTLVSAKPESSFSTSIYCAKLLETTETLFKEEIETCGVLKDSRISYFGTDICWKDSDQFTHHFNYGHLSDEHQKQFLDFLKKNKP